MLGWALIINNLGRRRYPIYWWAAGKTFVSAKPLADEKEIERELREVEAGLRSTEGAIFGHANDERELREVEAGLRSTEGAIFGHANDVWAGPEDNNNKSPGPGDRAGDHAVNGSN